MENDNSELAYSPDALAERQGELLALLRQTAPEVISDNQVDIEKFKELIGEGRIAPAEHYELSWAGKANARREIQKTTSHTLLPAASNPPLAPQMLIEGENLEVLRALQKSYHGKVKIIYIDPPYNTGNDSFVYPDDYSETLDEYQKRTGEKNEAGYLNKKSLWKKNSKESGQYHSAWLSMMYPRLYLARNLLRNDGVIFISIDDNEAANLKLLCDEVFGEECFIADAIWRSKDNSNNDSKRFSGDHNHTLIYSKSPSWQPQKLFDDSKRSHFKNQDNDPKGPYFDGNPLNSPNYRENLIYPIFSPGGVEISPPKNGWRWSRETMQEKIESGEIRFTEDGRGIRRRTYLKDMEGLPPSSLWIDLEKTGHNRQAKYELLKLIPEDVFDTPKPVKLVRYILDISGCAESDIVLDFFAGSGTTAQAVMELNLTDGGNRQCICVQMPELLDETSEAYKAGYRTIADITRARIDKVITKLKAEYPDKTADLACAHFTLAPSNFKVWRGDMADEAALRETLSLFQSAEKSGHAPKVADAQTAMLAELLLKHGLGALGVHAVSKPVQHAGVTVHRVLMHDDKQLWLCFEPYSSALKDEISKARPAQVVLLNSCFVGDKADELLSNLQLELAGLDIALTVI
ncbi:site-specific DNA-methyltransferase [Pseudomonas syringae]|uniref:site-specific DNA-methyltransferase n=1 Tax=Pseudomonas syringae TaxID=317 RepID=UPI003F74C9BC